MVKSPKIYVRDTGLFHFLLGIGFEKSKVETHPKFGASFETFCLEQIIANAELKDPSAEYFFFRTQAGLEVDLVLRFKGQLIPIEIKVSPPSQVRSLESAMADLKAKKGYIVNASGHKFQASKGVSVLSLGDMISSLR